MEVLDAVRRLDKGAPLNVYFDVEADRAGDFTIWIFEKSKEKKPDTEKESFTGNFEDASKWIYNMEKGN